MTSIAPMAAGWGGICAPGPLADIYIPSLVQFITGPLLWSLYGVTLIFTIPMILAVGFIEALVLRRYSTGLRLWTLTWRLAILNAFTSLLGTYFTWPGTNLWPGLVVAFLLTVLIEAGLLRLGRFGLPKGFPALGYLKASAYMNGVSYGLLAVVLAGLIYLPVIGKEDRALAKAVSGKVVIAGIYGLDTVELKTGRLIPAPSSHRRDFQPWTFMQTREGELYALGDDTREKSDWARFIWSRGAWRRSGGRPPVWTNCPIAISPNEKLLLYAEEDFTLVVDREANKIVRSLSAGIGWGRFSYDNRFLVCGKRWSDDLRLIDLKTGKETLLPDARFAAFNPAAAELAWVEYGAERNDSLVIYDCLKGKTRNLHLPGSAGRVSFVAWSPDGKYLAYLGDVNSYTKRLWMPNLRVIDAGSGRSATVYHGLLTMNATTSLFWVK